jgi:hypothetical protein
MGKLGLDSKGATVWEPRNEHKGDVARALFYMCVAYNGINGKSWVLPAQQDQAVLKKWHLQDPPDNWEMTRNEYIASLQNNRNPFIDSPSWAARIDFSTLTLVGSITPTIAVSSPTLAEKVLAGTVKNITWLSAGMDSIKIEYTTNGSTYTPVANSVAAASGTYAWMVPATASTNVRVKLTDKASTATATSPVFIIAVPSVALTSPVGGEVWKSKDTNTIAWTSSDIDTVKIQLWLSDTLHSTIIAKTPASAGSYKWNANPILSSVQAKVKISDIKSSASSTSTNYFTLQSNVGLNETTANMDDVIRVFPNPSKGQVSVIAPANARINIYTIEGKKLNAATKQEHDAFVYPKLDAGIYLLEIDIADKKVYRKVVVE